MAKRKTKRKKAKPPIMAVTVEVRRGIKHPDEVQLGNVYHVVGKIVRKGRVVHLAESFEVSGSIFATRNALKALAELIQAM